MNFEPLRPLADHLWQSTLFAGVAGLVTLLLGKNRARVRHGVWLAASCKFLMPASVLIGLGGQLAWRTAPPGVQPSVVVVMNEVSRPFAGPIAVGAPAVPGVPVPAVLCALWAFGFAGIACSWFVRWRRIRALVRAGSSMHLGLPIRTVSSPALPEPGVVGILQPTLVLPDGIAEHLSPAQLNAVIVHELCHVRHRDNLAAAFQMFVETVFWFYPVVWWIGKRMIAERERACDEEVLRLGSEPETYAESILRVCALYVKAPLTCVSGVTGADLKKRVHAIVAGRREVDLSAARKALLAVLGTASLAVPILIGIWNAAPLRGQDKASLPLLPPTNVRFRSISIERCKTGSIWGEIAFRVPGRVVADCVTTASLIYKAWLNVEVPNRRVGQGSERMIPLEGDPVWVGSGNYRYRIDAQADVTASPGRMEGPMLQALLADRFGLKIRRVTRESPMYALKVAKGGAKLQPAKQGVCSGGVSLSANMLPPPNCFGYPIVGSLQFSRLEGQALSIEDLCRLLPAARPVVDQTGINGRFDFHLKFAGDGTPAALIQLYPPLPELLETQLGLRLEPFTGPREFLVVDRVEKPVPE
jgi:bla regulator protein BlaR1